MLSTLIMVGTCEERSTDNSVWEENLVYPEANLGHYRIFTIHFFMWIVNNYVPCKTGF